METNAKKDSKNKVVTPLLLNYLEPEPNIPTEIWKAASNPKEEAPRPEPTPKGPWGD